jgi:hypothetical protein
VNGLRWPVLFTLLPERSQTLLSLKQATCHVGPAEVTPTYGIGNFTTGQFAINPTLELIGTDVHDVNIIPTAAAVVTATVAQPK